MQGCCSTKCEKKEDCGRYYANLKEPAYLEDWANFGSGHAWTDKNGQSQCEVSFSCGINGEYAMFIPIIEEMK